MDEVGVREAHESRALRVPLKKTCNRCQTPKELDLFGLDARNADGRQGRCRSCVRAVRISAAAANRKAGLCFCGEPRADDSKFCPRHRDSSKCHYQRYKQDPVWDQNRKAQGKADRLHLKLTTFDAYGGRFCRCCGENRVEFLSLDHIEGARATPRTASNRKANGLYSWLKGQGYPPGFRVLCMNCNFALGHAGYCPHERERQAASGVSQEEP